MWYSTGVGRVQIAKEKQIEVRSWDAKLSMLLPEEVEAWWM